MLVAETADMAQKWPEVVSPKHKGLEVPGVPMATLPSLHFFFFPLTSQSFSCTVFQGEGKVSRPPPWPGLFLHTPSSQSHTLFGFGTIAVG